MREILNKQALRQLELLEYLYDKDKVSQKELELNLNISKKSIWSDIQAINQQTNSLEIKTSSKNGIKLVIPNNQSVSSIYSSILSSSLEFSLIERLFFKEDLSAESLANHFFISLSTLQRTVKKINKVLSKKGFYISSKPYKLTGHEPSIRNFMIHFFFEKYSNMEFPFSTIKLSFLDKVFDYVLKQTDVNMNYPDIEKLRVMTIVAITRIKNGNELSLPVTFEPGIYDTILKNKLFVSSFKALFKFKLDEQNLNDLFGVFSNKTYALNRNHLNEIIQLDEQKQILSSMCENLIIEIADSLKISVLNFDELHITLFNLINLYYGDDYVLFNKTKHFLLNSNSLNLLFFQAFDLAFEKTIDKNTHFYNQKYNLCYSLITIWEDLQFQLAKKIAPVHIGLFFNSDIGHLHFLKNYLHFIFPDKCIFHISSDLSLTSFKKNSDHFDLVITNVTDVQLNKVPVVCCSLSPTVQELSSIAQFIDLQQKKIATMNYKRTSL